ncbi:MAG TPA: hypothetical protein PK299_12275, partial [Anaerolineales bacterium]|nr:hypothetical protein [Anaerolineales bacterium]
MTNQLTHRLTIFLLLCLLAVAPARAANLSVYGDSTSWGNWSWNTTANFANTNPTQAGTNSIAVTYTAGWAGLSLRTSPAQTTSGYTGIRFWAHGGADGANFQLYIQQSDSGAASTTINLNPPANTWQSYTITWAQLGNPTHIARINFQENTGSAQNVFYLDEIEFLEVASNGNALTDLPDNTSDGQTAPNSGNAGIAISLTGRVYLARHPISRIHSWASTAQMLAGDAPDLVFGTTDDNPDEDGCAYAPAAHTLCGVESLAVDRWGNLYAADTYFHRVLVFLDPASDPTPTTADIVLGQPNFSSGTPDNDFPAGNSIREGFYYPRGLALDNAERLYVVDEFNQRVLWYELPLVAPYGDTLPDGVLGQADLNTLGSGTADAGAGVTGLNRFRLPLGVAVDWQRRVYVSDYPNNRVLRFAFPTSNSPTANASYSVSSAHDLAADSFGNLFVGSNGGGQVQAFLDDGNQTPDRTYTASYPMGITFDLSGNLWVAEEQYLNPSTNWQVRLFYAPAPSHSLTVQTTAPALETVSHHLFGTNLVPWNWWILAGNPTLKQSLFTAIAQAPLDTLRMPGGSWGNTYGWLACELQLTPSAGTAAGGPTPSNLTSYLPAHAQACRAWDSGNNSYFSILGWAAKPSNYLELLTTTNKSGMWVVNPNGTPQEAAALVAFFNGDVSDARVIGVDSNGDDWGSVGRWASLRALRGYSSPLGIRYWAVGNEVYANEGCPAPWSYGWEPLWTCEGEQFVNGITGHAGFSAFRAAMQTVDATVQVGLVGDVPGTAWQGNDSGGWGREVLTTAGANQDFYDVHHYALGSGPATLSQSNLAVPHSLYSSLKSQLQADFTATGVTPSTLALTEHNYVLQFGDPNQAMTKAINALFQADVLGQLATHGFDIANQFMLYDTDDSSNGYTNFAMMRLMDSNRGNGGSQAGEYTFRYSPQYFAYALWGQAQGDLLASTQSLNAPTQLSAYAVRDAGQVWLVVINKQSQTYRLQIDLQGFSPTEAT